VVQVLGPLLRRSLGAAAASTLAGARKRCCEALRLQLQLITGGELHLIAFESPGPCGRARTPNGDMI
jgi:hypothetical protein